MPAAPSAHKKNNQSEEADGIPNHHKLLHKPHDASLTFLISMVLLILLVLLRWRTAITEEEEEIRTGIVLLQFLYNQRRVEAAAFSDWSVHQVTVDSVPDVLANYIYFHSFFYSNFPYEHVENIYKIQREKSHHKSKSFGPQRSYGSVFIPSRWS